jgi:hypothetical protein
MPAISVLEKLGQEELEFQAGLHGETKNLQPV